uniref:Ig-like domain-containing protein n=1 Tax=Hucho hucho TaxID=62062 RepID=A0A4W5LD01_9TELE
MIVELFRHRDSTALASCLVSDVQYGRLGSNVTLVCGAALDRTSVKWRLNRSSMLPWQHRVTSDGHLVLLQADHAAEGNYSCHDDQGLLIRTTRLRLGRKSPFSSPSQTEAVTLNLNHSLERIPEESCSHSQTEISL